MPIWIREWEFVKIGEKSELPVMRIHELMVNLLVKWLGNSHLVARGTHAWGYTWSLHFVQYTPDFCQVLQMRPLRIQGTFRAVTDGHGVNDNLRDTTRMNLKMKGPSDRILPYLKGDVIINGGH